MLEAVDVKINLDGDLSRILEIYHQGNSGLDMKATASSGKRDRLEARITPEQKALFQRAASLTGRSLTDFIVGSVQAAAAEAIRTHQMMELTARETESFAAALLNPPELSEVLRTGASRYRKLVSRV